MPNPFKLGKFGLGARKEDRNPSAHNQYYQPSKLFEPQPNPPTVNCSPHSDGSIGTSEISLGSNLSNLSSISSVSGDLSNHRRASRHIYESPDSFEFRPELDGSPNHRQQPLPTRAPPPPPPSAAPPSVPSPHQQQHQPQHQQQQYQTPEYAAFRPGTHNVNSQDMNSIRPTPRSPSNPGSVPPYPDDVPTHRAPYPSDNPVPREKDPADRAVKEQNASAENVRRLRELIRQKYELDLFIWKKRRVAKSNRKMVLRKCEEADRILQEIYFIINMWDDDLFHPEERQLVKMIKSALQSTQLENGQSNEPAYWMNLPPWER